VPLLAQCEQYEIGRDQRHSETRGEGNQSEALGDSEQIPPQGRKVVLHRGKHRGRDLAHEARDPVDGNVGQIPAQLVEAQRCSTEDSAGDEKVGVRIRVPREPGDENVPGEGHGMGEGSPARPREPVPPQGQRRGCRKRGAEQPTDDERPVP